MAGIQPLPVNVSFMSQNFRLFHVLNLSVLNLFRSCPESGRPRPQVYDKWPVVKKKNIW